MAKKVMSAEQFTSGDDRKQRQWCELSDLWGVEPEVGYWVGVMGGLESDSLEAASQTYRRDSKGNVIGWEPNVAGAKTRLIVRCLYDAETGGNRVFKDSDAGTITNKVGAAAIGRLHDLCEKVNGIGKDDQESIEKNSEGGQAGNSSSSCAAPGSTAQPTNS